jgi:magnesium chelatase family protein
MLAQRLPSILPALTPPEMLQLSMVRSVAGDLDGGRLSPRRPFRAPHHSASMAAMIGGGMRARPGEVSLAHHGVLFLDELPEFSPQVLDSLRQPLESGEAVIARANHRISYPARFQLITAMNPCRCGMAGEPGHTCRRGARCASDYQARLSGPLLDRIDLHLDIPAVSASDLMLPPATETSALVADRVAAARGVQAQRAVSLGLDPAITNASLPTGQLEQVAQLDALSRQLMQDAADRLGLSARGFHRVLRVARTLADLSGAEALSRPHLAEALSYRGSLGRMGQAEAA